MSAVPAPAGFLRQHLIDPEVCIRCNTCEETCPVDAITHDGRNYVVDPAVCNGCNACIAPCPTGSIDHWHWVPEAHAYSLDEQFGWDELPVDAPPAVAESSSAPALGDATVVSAPLEAPEADASAPPSSVHPPWSAAHPYLNLYGLRTPVVATVAGNVRITAPAAESDVRHIVLDLGQRFFPVLEGQSVGVIPPGTDAFGRPHHLRMYSVASPRGGEREGYNNLALTVKRVVVDPAGRPVRGVASNYLCDLRRGDTVRLTGPFGERFLMPNHPGSNLLMICTGTGSAPMRAMTERRRRLATAAGEPAASVGGRLMLFFGARRSDELPYFGPLTRLPRALIDTNLAFSREPGQPRRYVQDLLRERGADVAALLEGDTFVYVCGLKGMEAGVFEALREIGTAAGSDWAATHRRLLDEGRLHIETY